MIKWNNSRDYLPEPTAIVDKTILKMMEEFPIEVKRKLYELLPCYFYRGIETGNFYLEVDSTIFTHESASLDDIAKLIEDVWEVMKS